MSENADTIQILIPTYNSVEQIDATMQSIYKQTVGMEHIYITIMDFASTDDTYRKLLNYDSYHLGIYQYPKQINQRNQMREMVPIVNLFPFSTKIYYIGLYPGTILYPEFLSCCTKLFEEEKNADVDTIICEADILSRDAQIVHQSPLYSRLILLKEKRKTEYFMRNGWHQVIWLSKMSFGMGRHFTVGMFNNLNDWYQQFYRNYNKTVLYLPECLGCVAEKTCDNELEQLMMDKAALDRIIRTFENEELVTAEEKRKMNLQSAYFALWKSFQMFQIGNKKEAEDCLLFSEILSEDIRKTKIFEVLKSVNAGTIELPDRMEELFPKEQTSDLPADKRDSY